MTGEVELSQTANAALKIGLPENTFSGIGKGQFVLNLPKGQPPALLISSIAAITPIFCISPY